MKTAIVPAQITTVEDRIAGNLSFTQMMLLVAPILVTGIMFILLPPLVQVALYKLLIGGGLLLICGLLAIRVQGELILNRIITLIRYNLRPKYYIYDKNDTYMRYIPTGYVEAGPEAVAEIAEVESYIATLIDTPQLVRIETAISDPRAEFRLRVQKGGLRVYINEVKEKGI